MLNLPRLPISIFLTSRVELPFLEISLISGGTVDILLSRNCRNDSVGYKRGARMQRHLTLEEIPISA